MSNPLLNSDGSLNAEFRKEPGPDLHPDEVARRYAEIAKRLSIMKTEEEIKAALAEIQKSDDTGDHENNMMDAGKMIALEWVLGQRKGLKGSLFSDE